MDAELEPTIDRLFGLSKKSAVSIKFRNKENSILDKRRDVFINASPKGLEREYRELFTNEFVEFMVDLNLEFENQIEELYNRRLQRKLELRRTRNIPKFSKTKRSLDENWKVEPVGERFQNRHLDLGDVSPSDRKHFIAALRSPVQGIQVDFDDGHCPTWANQIFGLHNVAMAVRGSLKDAPKIEDSPILMLRPRAWNMIETNISINGRLIAGPMFDYSCLIYHNGARIMEKTGIGASFYLSKIESSEEAKLWNDIFVWSENRLGFSRGTIKACVLIENILSAFEMDDILWELREHSLGLNCGIWDYAASIISKFGTNNVNFLLPDRKKYVNTRQKFLISYMQLVVKICHKRGIHATGGMAANILPLENVDSPDLRKIIATIRDDKLREIEIGLDGFLIYDLGLVDAMNELWREKAGNKKNQIDTFEYSKLVIRPEDLLILPKGGVTVAGLEHNIRVAVLFIFQWFNGRGHFFHNGNVEDSATAEISRSQVWQWIRYGAKIEDDEGRVTRYFVKKTATRIVNELRKNYGTVVDSNTKICVALNIFLDLVNERDFPEFITTYLNEKHIFRKFHSNL